MNFIVQALCPLGIDCIKINMCNLSSGESLEPAGTLPESLLSQATIHCMNECGGDVCAIILHLITKPGVHG